MLGVYGKLVIVALSTGTAHENAASYLSEHGQVERDEVLTGVATGRNAGHGVLHQVSKFALPG